MEPTAGCAARVFGVVHFLGFSGGVGCLGFFSLSLLAWAPAEV
ncbi:MAG: hypothetical protein ABDI20_01620 [Candidatus Bipolaricaulaceae bacterium]